MFKPVAVKVSRDEKFLVYCLRLKSHHEDLRLRFSWTPEERASTARETILFESKVAANVHASFRFPEFSLSLLILTKQTRVRCARWQGAARPSRSVSER